MKASMDSNGVITIKAETPMEQYVLGLWADKALIKVDDHRRMEEFYFRSSLLIIDHSDPENGDE
jgi:hypothetical protein